MLHRWRLGQESARRAIICLRLADGPLTARVGLRQQTLTHTHNIGNWYRVMLRLSFVTRETSS